MNKKTYFLTLLFCMATMILQAQYLTTGGITIQATSTLYVENNEAKSASCDQLYNISFKDQILVHNIYSSGVLNVSQVYQLSDIERFKENDETVIRFTALSGRSKLTYKYVVKINEADELISMVCTQEDGTKTTFKGNISELRTFKQ